MKNTTENLSTHDRKMIRKMLDVFGMDMEKLEKGMCTKSKCYTVQKVHGQEEHSRIKYSGQEFKATISRDEPNGSVTTYWGYFNIA